MHGCVILSPTPHVAVSTSMKFKVLEKIFLYNDHNGIDAIKEITKLSII
jgi:hypothetical protein